MMPIRPTTSRTASGSRAPLAGLLVLLALLAPLPALAQGKPSTARIYTIENVKVDVTAESAVAAREQAMAQAFGQALQRLEARLVAGDALSRVPTTDPNGLLRDFEVTEEKVSTTRYIGTMTVRFAPEKVRGFLRSVGVPFRDTAADPLLVLPVFETNGQPVLFESSNPWLTAWGELPAEIRLVPIVRPQGDLDDLKAISAQQALAGDQQALSAIASRYKVQNVLVADAALRQEGDSSTAVVKLTQISGEVSTTDSFEAKANPGEDQQALLNRAASAVTARLEDQWKAGKLAGEERTLLAAAPIASLGEWVNLRAQLEQIGLVRRIEIVALSPTEARIVLHYIGEPSRLIGELAAHGLTLQPDPMGTQTWVLRPQGAAGPMAAAPGTMAVPGPAAGPTGALQPAPASGAVPIPEPAPAQTPPDAEPPTSF